MSAIDSDREKFLAWKVKWGKDYATKEEDESRFQTFKQNLREIEAFNSRSSARWWKGLNMFSDLTDEQFKTEFLGCKHPTMYKDVGDDEVMCWGSSSDDEEDTEEGHAAVKCQGPAAPPKEATLPEEPKPKRPRLDDSLLVPEDQFLTQHPRGANGAMSAIDSDREKFLAWKVKWGKDYATKEEDESRFQTFKQNLREIEAFNSRSSARWWKGLNMFSDLTDEQFKTEFLGCKHPTMYKDVGGDEVMCWGSSSDDEEEEEDTKEGYATVKRQSDGRKVECCSACGTGA
ncbi:putative fruit bromelain [Helianthus annuus]|uniref:Fruit bromelain n=2 Tax=Helianthus annuus TaxID=4232 RepID=A0A9K3NL66_HELAN|nr:uncharacterized protein LOC110865957 [Helianthus annuus]KAF5803735.1 putative fruit bromelain [Helianthus annuus]KAJ0561646.1 putative fruit bromelain [Helianthus annuus]KAJ0574710.1 putative fruit bromelain [Helianthus annuus]KAJ0739041.1 putative fruit bromelain [Helianthus annuus]KAJ0741903.1 putative fruit bromelain [Helianthus annuus]